ncbi:MAG: DUF1957 domain-containing protein [Treponema sp.]|jgi:1,4-alpha-glucan branching enzyme|nr:DUF1957 domain-containing protein [Treponema sp.]
MNQQAAFSIILFGHHPFVFPSEKKDFSEEEQDYFESLSETWLSLLDMLEILEKEAVSFRLGLILSPTLCGMFQDSGLQERYSLWLNKRINFGEKEIKRCAANTEMKALAELYYSLDCRRKEAITEKYGMDILEAFNTFQKRGRLEFILTAATNAYLPFYPSMKEAIRAQIETALIHHRKYIGNVPTGFWLPDLGWTTELGDFLHEYGFSYTITDAHSLCLTRPQAANGIFHPIKTTSGLLIFCRDTAVLYETEKHIEAQSSVYRSSHDAGFELSPKALKQLLGTGNSRCSTGYRYWNNSEKKKLRLYNPRTASEAAVSAAKTFLEQQSSRLNAAGQHVERPISVCAFNADTFFRSWYEGKIFLETLIKEIFRQEPGLLCTASDYLAGFSGSFQVSDPCFSSALQNGYAEILLDASNDWIYRHLFRSIERMVEMTERFSGDTGLRERALNQAARELLFAQSTDWSKALNPQYQCRINRDYAEQELEGALRNFTTIYEALGSSHISTEWLTALERKHSFLPYINHRVFCRKK